MGWRAGQKSLLLPVAGESFLLTLPFIERRNLAPDRTGEIVECPHCHEHALKVEDFKDPMSGSKEKETIYIHCEGMVLQGSWKAIGSRRTT